jgi:hypothetical protein
MVKTLGILPILTEREVWFTEVERNDLLDLCPEYVGLLVYGSDAWTMKAKDLQRLERTDNMMVRWM